MKKSFFIAGTIIAGFTMTANALVNETTYYQNLRGSTLVLIKHPETKNSGTVSGTFTTAVASKNCQSVIGKPHPIIGFYAGDAVSFSVSYPTCGAVLAVIGNVNKKSNIETLWIDAHQSLQPEGKDWNTRMIGNDEFKLLRKKAA